MLRRSLQQDDFAEKNITVCPKIKKFNQTVRSSLRPRIDANGLSRSSGWLENAEYLDYDVKFPIILPRGDWITNLLVQHYHERGCHISGINHTLAQLVQRYWTIRGREEVHECENQCYYY